MNTAREQLLAEIEAFIARHDIRASYFGRDIAGDFSLVHRLRRGSGVRLETVDRIRRYIADYDAKHKRLCTRTPSLHRKPEGCTKSQIGRAGQ